MSLASNSWVAQLVFYVIAITAFLGNALVLWVFARKWSKSKETPFDFFIINLAASDLLASVFLIFSRFLFAPALPESESGAFAYCSILWGGFILFGLGYVSVYTCLALAFERWLAVVKPHVYRRMTKKHAVVAIFLVWILAFLINSTVFFSVKANSEEGQCEWVDPKIARPFFAFVEICMSNVFPFLLITIFYAHIYFKVHRTFVKEDAFKRRLTIIALVASIALIVGWLPVKISFMLRYTSVGSSHLHGTAHLVFIMMALSNCCVNPFLYGIYSSKFRAEYKKILCKILCKKCSVKDMESASAEDTNDIKY